MADLSDVENAMADEIIAALYPNGTGMDSIAGVTCRVYRGWPSPAALNADLAAGIVNVTVFPAPAAEELPDPYLDASYAAIPASHLMLAVNGQSIALTGQAVPGEIVGILVDGVPYTHQVMEKDTPDSITANLSVLIRQDRPVSLSHAVLTVPGARTLLARVVANASVSRGLRRQRRDLQVSCWCPTPLLRDTVSKELDTRLSRQTFIGLADETKAHVRYISTQIHDQSQSALLYRRDLCYKCEYTTIARETLPVMLFGELSRNGKRSLS